MKNTPIFKTADELLKVYPNGNARVEIPDGVTEIEWEALELCEGVEEIVIPKTMCAWPGLADWSHCKSLKKIVFADFSQRRISTDLFCKCPSLESVVFGEGVEIIKTSAFYRCPSLKKIWFAADLKEIEASAFSNCPSLEEVSIHKDAKVQEGAFVDCPNLKITVRGDNFADTKKWITTTDDFVEVQKPRVDHSKNTSVLTDEVKFEWERKLEKIEPNGNLEIVVPEGIHYINLFSLTYCENIEYLEFPETVTGISSSALKYCKNLKKLVCPGSLKNITSVFQDLRSLEELVLKEGIENICNQAFMGCESLKKIVFPSTLKTIGDNAFGNCASLCEITLPKAIKSVDKNAFYNCPQISLSFENGTPERKIKEITEKIYPKYQLYFVCDPEDEGAEIYRIIYDERVAIKKVTLEKEEFDKLFEQTLAYKLLVEEGREHYERKILADEAIFKYGEFFGVRYIYYDSGDWNDGGVYIEEPYSKAYVQKIDQSVYIKDTTCSQKIVKKE